MKDQFRVVIFGGNGMVGRNLSGYLSGTTAWRLLTPTSTEVDLLDYDGLAEYLRAEKPTHVVHLAGRVGGIMDNIAHPYEYLYVNSQIGLNLIEAVGKLADVRFLNISSSCIYPPDAPQPFTTDSLLQGSFEPTNEGYAIAKMLALKACEYRNQELREARFKTIIPCNLFGPYDKFSTQKAHMIPAVIARMHDAVDKGKTEVDLWGHPDVRREFMYVTDLCAFIRIALEKFTQLPQNTNVGLGRDYTISEYYHEIARVVGYEGKIVVDDSKPIGMPSKLIDSSVAEEVLGWKAGTTLASGLEQIYQYYKAELL